MNFNANAVLNSCDIITVQEKDDVITVHAERPLLADASLMRVPASKFICNKGVELYRCGVLEPGSFPAVLQAPRVSLHGLQELHVAIEASQVTLDPSPMKVSGVSCLKLNADAPVLPSGWAGNKAAVLRVRTGLSGAESLRSVSWLAYDAELYAPLGCGYVEIEACDDDGTMFVLSLSKTSGWDGECLTKDGWTVLFHAPDKRWGFTNGRITRL